MTGETTAGEDDDGENDYLLARSIRTLPPIPASWWMRPHERAASSVTPNPRIPMSNGRAPSLKWWIIGFAVVEAILIATVLLLRF